MLCVARAREFPRRHFDAVLQERALGRVVGILRLSLHGRGYGDLGYAIPPEFWNRGFTTGAVRAVPAEARKSLDLGEVWATVDPSNAPSCRIMEKVGFRHCAGEAGAPIKPGRPPSRVYVRDLTRAADVPERTV